MKTLKDLLVELNFPEEDRNWIGDMTIEEVVEECDEADLLLWLIDKINLPVGIVTLIKARCANTILDLMEEESRNAVLIAEKFGLGKASLEELNVAADTSSKIAKEKNAKYWEVRRSYYGAYPAKRVTDFRAAEAASLATDIVNDETRHTYYTLIDAAWNSCYDEKNETAAIHARSAKKKEILNILKTNFGNFIIQKINQLLSQN